MNYFYTLVLVPLLITITTAQNRNCSTMEYLETQKAEDAILEERMQAIEAFTQKKVKQFQKSKFTDNVITIPVVVHVIYNKQKENISNAQIQSQIDVLNEDFRRLNTDADNKWPQAADTKIQFCLANIDPEGKLTSGITRKYSEIISWGLGDKVKNASKGGVNAWDTSSYLNMWVCNIGMGYLGYAQFPGGNPKTDGIVIAPQFFGSSAKGNNFYIEAPFDLGRTATHEVGHYLNLRHIWGDAGCSADDFVEDTPKSNAPNFGCQTNHYSCGTKDMVQNYMDYSNDACLNVFTKGQKDRMRSLFVPGGFRHDLMFSNKCDTSIEPTCTDGVQNGDETGIDCGGSCEPCETSCKENSIELAFTFDAYPEETSWIVTNSLGEVINTKAYSTANKKGETVVEKLCLPDGCYTLKVKDVYGDGMCCTDGDGSYTITDNSGVLFTGGTFTDEQQAKFCVGDIEAIPTIISEGSFETGWDNWSSGGNDCYRYFGKRSYEGDYSIRLRDGSGEESAITSSTLNLSEYKAINVEFYFYSFSMEKDDHFLFRYFDGSKWATVASWYSIEEFQNNTFYKASVSLNATDFEFTNNVKFRFQNNSSTNSDYIYIDKIKITGTTSQLRTVNSKLEAIRTLVDDNETETDFTIYPNPNSGTTLYVKRAENLNGTYAIINMVGQVMYKGSIIEEIPVGQLKEGMYFIEFSNEAKTVVKKFIKK